MSTQSGISASEDLLSKFKNFVSSKSRAIVARIHNESVIHLTDINAKETPESDFAQLADIVQGSCSYVFYREHDGPDGLVFISYVPDDAPVRQKMLYASSRNSLMRQLGSDRFGRHLFVTELAEFSTEGYISSKKHEALAAPLTQEEASLLYVKEKEADSLRGTNQRRSHIGSTGVQFPVTEDTLETLRSLSPADLVQLEIDFETEQIKLANKTNTSVNELGTTIESENPRFSFYMTPENKLVFIYTCPGASKIKHRMVYASTKSGVIAQAKSAGVDLFDMFETSEPENVTEQLMLIINPPPPPSAKKFARPQRQRSARPSAT
ncbi:hypothetical protein CANCADRAFT_59419 [Tortispora caseinolytica NRRL Y-17796]|uniref:ADF-H domain-containing protein n=1 Tax=Tortispora caseinolytica NRRL Y-17796 TaxID=767744 RepID=A0A1E4TKC2_9ASCO|nr:hypothetical protein CANCADRAFT_59419 [Tortispora caseinolytica NRRL Y-17796]